MIDQLRAKEKAACPVGSGQEGFGFSSNADCSMMPAEPNELRTQTDEHESIQQ